MNDEEAIKKKLLQKQQEAMSQQMMQQAAHQQAINQQLELLKTLMTEILEPKARERLNNLKLVKPEVATQIQVYLAQAYQAGHIKGKITDEQLVTILRQIETKKDFKIRRK